MRVGGPAECLERGVCVTGIPEQLRTPRSLVALLGCVKSPCPSPGFRR